MEEWPDVRRPWYKTYWRWVIGWMVIVVVLFIFASVRRVIDFHGAQVMDCQGIVRSLREEPAIPGANAQPVIYANVQVRGEMVEIVVDRKAYPYLRVGDRVDLTCRVGRTGMLFVQRWRPMNNVEE
jgi:hypothetical protein